MAEEVRELRRFVHEVKGVKGKKYNNYALTELGREKAEEYGGSGLEFDIMDHIVNHGSCTLREISDGIHIEERKVKAALERLIAKGRIIRVAR